MRSHSRRLAVLGAVAMLAALPAGAAAQTPVDREVNDAIDKAPDPVDATQTPSVPEPAPPAELPRDALPTVGTHPDLPDVTVPLPNLPVTGTAVAPPGTADGTSGGTAKAWPGGAFVSRSTPVIFVHGLDWKGTSSVNCRGTWGVMRDAMRDYGWTGTFSSVGYYDYDEECTHRIDHHGSHSAHYASGH